MLLNKYKPFFLSDIKHNTDTINNLINIKDNMNHFFFYGRKGSGKNTIVLAYLNNLFNNDCKIYDRNSITMNLQINNSNINVNIITSLYHFEINCEDFNDKRIVNHFIKCVSKTNNISTNKSKIIIIKHIELLSIEYQWMLRRTIEKVYKTCKIIFITNNLSKIDNSIISRCFCIRIQSPQDKELFSILKDISDQENLSIQEKQIEYIIKKSQRNITTAITLLEYSTINNKYTKPYLHYNEYIKEIINLVFSSTDTSNMTKIRSMLHNILLYDININIFTEHLLNAVINNDILNMEKKNIIINIISFYESTMICAYKKIYHLEAMVSNIILILNTPESELINFQNNYIYQTF